MPSLASRLSDIPRFPRLLKAIFRLIEERCNENSIDTAAAS